MPGQTRVFPSRTAQSGAPWDPREMGGSQEEGGDLWAYFRHKAISQYVPEKMFSASFVLTWPSELLARIPPSFCLEKGDSVLQRPALEDLVSPLGRGARFVTT